jgi:hypothetical protein
MCGENFVQGPDKPDATSPLNKPHGTWVACNIGANVRFGFPHDSALATAVRNNCNPVSTLPCAVPATITAPGGQRIDVDLIS